MCDLCGSIESDHIVGTQLDVIVQLYELKADAYRRAICSDCYENYWSRVKLVELEQWAGDIKAKEDRKKICWMVNQHNQALSYAMLQAQQKQDSCCIA